MTNQAGLSRRGFLVRSAIATGGLIAGPALLSACSKAETSSGSRLDTLKSEGTITVGIAGEQPYAFLDRGELVGMAPAVQKEIWNAVGIEKVQAKQVAFDSLIPGLIAGDFDAIAAAIFITPERCEQAAFSDPLFCATDAFMVPTGNPDNISGFESVAKAGIKLGVFSGAVEGDYARDAGVSGDNIVTVPDMATGVTQLEQGRIQAIGLTSITLSWHLKQNPEVDAEVTEPFIPVVDGKEVLGCGAMTFRKEDTDLVEAFNKELAKLKESGEFIDMIVPFGFGPETLPPDDVTTESLCKGVS